MAYEYMDDDGDKLLLASGTHGVLVEADPQVVVNYADAPAVALELLKAAGQESVIVPKAYEEVVRNGAEITCGTGPEKAYGAVSQNPNWLYSRAANDVALAQYIEGAAVREAAEKAEVEAAEKKLSARRHELARELSGNPSVNSYRVLSDATRNAIDLIVDLEEKLAAK